MSTSTSVAVVLVEDPMKTEAIAVAGFLAGYCGSTRRSYATDLRLSAAWCHEANLSLSASGVPTSSCSAGGWRRWGGCAPPWPFLVQAGLGLPRDHAWPR